MTYETYRMIFEFAGILTIIFLGVSICLFFFLKIPKIVGDLSGASARRAIADIRSRNERMGIPNRAESVPIRNICWRLNLSQLKWGEDRERALRNAQTGIDFPAASKDTETVVLTESESLRMQPLNETWQLEDFVIEEELCFIHTNETIG